MYVNIYHFSANSQYQYFNFSTASYVWTGLLVLCCTWKQSLEAVRPQESQPTEAQEASSHGS